MKLLSIILGSFLILSSANFAEAQSCSGQFQSGQVCNNPTSGVASPQATFNPVFGNGSNQGSVTLFPGSGSSAPSSLQNGELWTNAVGVFARINGTTVGPFTGSSAGSFAATEPITVSFPSNVVTYGFDYSFAGTFLALQSFQANISIGTTGLGNIGQPGTGISVGSSLFPSIIAPLNTTVTATGSTSPNITVSSGAASQIANGDTISGAVVPGNCCYFVLSGGGTTSIVMSGNASGAGALAAIFGVSRYSATSAEIVNTIGAQNIYAGTASQRYGSWVGGWDTPYPFPTVTPLQSVSPNGMRAAGFYCRQSDNPGNAGIPTCETTVFITIMDVATTTGGWGQYLEADITNASVAGFLHVENDVYSVIPSATALAASTVYNYNGVGHTSTYRVAAGAGRVGGHNISTAFEAINNNNQFEVDYLCGDGSLDTASNRVGQCVSMASGQGLAFSHTPGGIATTAALAGGTGGTTGTYTNVAITGGSGGGTARATIVVAGGAVTSVTITTPGTGYVAGDQVSAASGNIGGTTGFSVFVVGLTTSLDFTVWSSFATNAFLNIGLPASGTLQILNGNLSNSAAVLAIQAAGMFPLSDNAYQLGVSTLGWSAIYTHGVELFGSSTGITTLSSLNSGASNFTINFPAASGTVALTSGVVSSVTNVDGTLTISPNVGAVVASCTVATTTQIGCAKFGTGLTITAGNVTPTFGTASGQVAQGGVISAGGPTGSATVAAIITWNAAGQLTAVTSATITPAVGSITGLGSGVATALGVNVGSAGAFVVNGGALGTPSSGTVTNLTGTASININGTVGATTPGNGTFTNLVANTSFLVTGTSYPASGTGISLSYDSVNNYGLIDAAIFGSTGEPIAIGTASSQGISIGSKINPGIGSLNINTNLFMPNLTTTSTAQTATVCWTSGGSPAGKFTGDTTLGCLSSREDWKKYITPLDDELQTEGIDAVGLLMSLQPISYEWINPIDEAQKGKQIGFGAKQVYGVDKRLGGLGSDGIPRAWRQDATLALAVDVLKKLVTEFDEYKRQHP